jgi:hypothetical protein
MYTLDLSQSTDMNTYASNWKLGTQNTNDVTLGGRVHTQNTVVSDHQMVVSGGFHKHGIADQTIVFDAVAQSWSRYTNYKEGVYGNRLM